MGKQDGYQSDFFEDKGRFADVFNGALFGGREVIRPEELEEAATKEEASPEALAEVVSLLSVVSFNHLVI